ncbi:MAG: VOC family protein [Blautia sp.]|nr:VOC family protein [Blautia sp.]
MKIADYATGLQHIGIPTKDIDETVLFYTELGFEVAHSTSDPNTGGRVLFLKLGNLLLETYEAEDAPSCRGSIEHIAINVTDVEAVYDTICKRGMNSLEDVIHFLPYWEKGVRYFTIEGPNKEKVEFSQYL